MAKESGDFNSINLVDPSKLLLIALSGLLDLITIITFIISLFYDLGILDVIGLFVNFFGGTIFLLDELAENLVRGQSESQDEEGEPSKRPEEATKTEKKDEALGSEKMEDWEKNKEGVWELNKGGGQQNAKGEATKISNRFNASTTKSEMTKGTSPKTGDSGGNAALAASTMLAQDAAKALKDPKQAAKDLSKESMKLLFTTFGKKEIPWIGALPWWSYRAYKKYFKNLKK